MNSPSVLFDARFVIGLIYAGVAIFAVSITLLLLSHHKLQSGQIRFWGRIFHHSCQVAIVAGVSTFAYAVTLFGLRHAYYGLLALAVSICVSAMIVRKIRRVI